MSAAQPTLGHLLSSWSLDPGLAAALALAGALYLHASTRRPGWPARRALSFLAGLGVLALALASGIDAYAEQLLSLHMIQHLLLSLLAPALLLYGAPVRLALGAGSPALRRFLARMLASRLVRLLTQPAVGLALFALVQLATHLTGLFELTLEDPWLHELEHAAFFASGLLLLAPLIAADPLPHAPAPLARFAWMMGAMTAMAVPGALLTFEASVRYGSYAAPARALGRSALTDQHVAGAIMWVGSGIAMFALALAVAMAAMLAEERRQRRRELHLDGAATRTERDAGALRA
jgi:putative membrane protein